MNPLGGRVLDEFYFLRQRRQYLALNEPLNRGPNETTIGHLLTPERMLCMVLRALIIAL